MKKLFAALSLFCAVSLAARVNIGPERDTALPELGPAVLMQWSQAVASDGRDYLVAWRDDRYRGVLTSHVSASGEPLDARPRQLPYDGIPALRWSGNDYVLVVATYYAVTLTHLDADGVEIGSPVILATTYREVTIGRTAILLSNVDGLNVGLDTFDFAGRPIASTRLPLPRSAFTSTFGVDDDDHFAANFTIYDSDHPGMYFTSFGPDLNPSAVTPAGPETPVGPSVGGADGKFTRVYWIDHQLIVDQVAADGTLLHDRVTLPVFSPPTVGKPVLVGRNLFFPVVLFLTNDPRDEMLRVNVDTLDAELIAFSTTGDTLPAAAATNDSNMLLVWQDGGGLVEDVASLAGERADITRRGDDLVVSASTQRNMRGASSGTNTLLTWTESRDDFFESIWFGKVDDTGAMLDGRGVRLSPTGVWATAPQVVFDGTSYVVVWREKRSETRWELVGKRVSPDGAVRDAGAFVVGDVDQESVGISSDNRGNTLIVRRSSATGSAQLFSSMLRADGTVGTGAQVSVSPWEPMTPVVAFDGTRFVVFWSDFHPNPLRCPPFGVSPPCKPYLRADLAGAVIGVDGNVAARLAPHTAEQDDVFYSDTKIVRAGAQTVLAYRLDSPDFSSNVVLARVGADGTLVVERSIGSYYNFELGAIGDVPLVISPLDLLSNPQHLAITEVAPDLLLGTTSQAAVHDLWDWEAHFVSAPHTGWLLYDRRALDERYVGAPRTFARRVTLDGRARPVRF